MQLPKIAILVDTATGWGRRVVRGVLDYAMQHGPWDVWIEPKGQDEAFRLPQDTVYDGVIARVASQELIDDLNTAKVPTVNVSGLMLHGADFPRVSVDWEAAARLAEIHFRDRALQHFAYVGPLHLSYVRAHEQAFEQRLAQSGTPCHLFQPEIKDGQGLSWPSQVERLIPWLQSLPKPIGIYTWAFQVGRTIINACREADIPVPHDVAVLGGDFDELLSDACHPALSGIVTPSREIGFKAASILHDIMRGKQGPPKPIFIEPEQIEERLSTETLAIDDPKMLQALSYLRAHACENIQIDDILKEIPMARRALERRFKHYIGRSPAQEMRRIRINHARKLLSLTNLDMQDIAEACGYSTYNYLGNVFKRETGISPGRYRNMTRTGHSELP